MEIDFSGGINIAIKIPKARYKEAVAFYQDILKLEVIPEAIDHPTVSQTHRVAFGPNVLWLDCVDHCTHSETWLELRTSDVDRATRYLATNGVETCDELEQLPADKHWIMDPAGTVFILGKAENKN